MWCLSRIDGVPQEISFWDVTEDAKVALQGPARSVAHQRAGAQHVSSRGSFRARVIGISRS